MKHPLGIIASMAAIFGGSNWSGTSHNLSSDQEVESHRRTGKAWRAPKGKGRKTYAPPWPCKRWTLPKLLNK